MTQVDVVANYVITHFDHLWTGFQSFPLQNLFTSGNGSKGPYKCLNL